MKMFALLLAFMSFSSFGAIIDGCYKTVSYNGQPVVQGPDANSNLSKIYSVTSHYYFSHNHSPLKTKVISIFKGFEGGWYSYTNPIVFDDLGKTTETSKSWSYQFEDFVKYTSSFYSFDEADFLTDMDFHWGEDGFLHGRVYQLTKVLDRMIDFEVVLEKAVCPID
ncbi:MAG: hypothetical protein WDA09_07600 [Bacteriovoracaceae bacterium]